MTAALAARGLTKRYGSFHAVEDLDLALHAGEVYGFIGPNGAGKTTAIRMFLGLVRPSAGSIELFGEPLGPARAALRRVGALVEEPAFWPFLSGRRNLRYLSRAAGGRADVRDRLERIDRILMTVGLSAAAGRKVRSYSQGMRQRLGIANALLGGPDLLVLDEPTNGLDPTGMREMRALLRALADDGAAVLVSSHLLGEVETICDRVGVMANGRLLAQGAPDALGGVRDRFEIEVGDVEDAARVLTGLEGVELVGQPARQRLTVSIDGLASSDVNDALVRGGVQVRSLVPVRTSLEDVFHALVSGDDVPR